MMLIQEPSARCDQPNSHAVRALARDARKVLASDGQGMDALELLVRIDRMCDAWRHMPAAPIHSWLKNLRREIEMS